MTARLREVPTGHLTPGEVASIRELLWEAFADEDGFTEEDWQHGLGGIHFVLDEDGLIIAHASVVERELHVGERPLRTGYVEAVGVIPSRQGHGAGSLVMSGVTAYIRERFELGALGTGRHRFYERLGWITWQGPLSVRAPDGVRRTPADEGYLLVLCSVIGAYANVTRG